MTYRDEWTPWTNHTGNECPIPDGYWVEALASDGEYHEGIVDHSRVILGGVNVWNHAECLEYGMWDNRIVDYRIKTPRALQEMRRAAAKLKVS